MEVIRMSEFKAEIKFCNTINNFQAKVCLTRSSRPHLNNLMKATQEEGLLGEAEGGGSWHS